MIRVQVRSNEPLEAALRRFKRQCNYAGIFRLAKKHSFHEKSSDKRRRERREKERSIQRLTRKPSERGGRPRRSGRKSRVKAPSAQGQNQESGATGEASKAQTPAPEVQPKTGVDISAAAAATQSGSNES
jgi:small subunit ribosomal protein S21